MDTYTYIRPCIHTYRHTYMHMVIWICTWSGRAHSWGLGTCRQEARGSEGIGGDVAWHSRTQDLGMKDESAAFSKVRLFGSTLRSWPAFAVQAIVRRRSPHAVLGDSEKLERCSLIAVHPSIHSFVVKNIFVDAQPCFVYCRIWGARSCACPLYKGMVGDCAGLMQCKQRSMQELTLGGCSKLRFQFGSRTE